MVLNCDVTCHIYLEDRNYRAILRYLFRLIVTQMRLLTSAVAFFAAAKATETDLAPECPVQPSCGCSAEDIEAWEGRISRWEGEMDRWEGSMREWKERQAASKFTEIREYSFNYSIEAQICGASSTTRPPVTGPPGTPPPTGSYA